MRRDDTVKALRAHEEELRAAGILHLSLFGSVARGEPAHDVDLMAEFDRSKRLTLLNMVEIERRLMAIVGKPVDLCPAHMLKDAVRNHAMNEAVRAF